MILPECFRDEASFFGYFLIHRETPSALFSGEQINYLYGLIGMPPPYGEDDFRENFSIDFDSEEMDQILEIIERKRVSLEDVSEPFETKGKVVYLADRRQNN